MNQPERDLKIECRKLAHSLGLVVWDNASGVAIGEKSVVSYGLCRGSSDLIGILSPSGTFVAIELKTKNGMRDHMRAYDRCRIAMNAGHGVTMDERRALEQRSFLELVSRCGGIAGFATSIDDFRELVERKITHEEILTRHGSTRRTATEPRDALRRVRDAVGDRSPGSPEAGRRKPRAPKMPGLRKVSQIGT